MSPPALTEHQNTTIVASKKAFDTTGHRHIFKVRGGQYSPLQRTKTNHTGKSFVCRNCDNVDTYIDTLEEYLEGIAEKVNLLSQTTDQKNKVDREIDFSGVVSIFLVENLFNF